MDIETLGPKLFERDVEGRLRSRVGTFFPRHRLLVTEPGIHAAQRMEFLDWLNAQRAARGETPLPISQEEAEMTYSVDLFFEPDSILIRPDPDHLDLAFEADELLQHLVSKRRIKFLFAFDPQVQQRFKERGECWRISPLPRSPEDIRALIVNAKAAIREQPIYYYNRATGTRYLTCHEFGQLRALGLVELARQLQEIADFSKSTNRLGHPEVAFFQADPARFSPAQFTGVRFDQLTPDVLVARYRDLAQRYFEAAPPDYRQDDPDFEPWRNQMYLALVSLPGDQAAEGVLRGLSPEFFLQVQWLPGARFEEGEIVFDSVFAEADDHPEDTALQSLCDRKARGFIFNFIREHGDLEYVNVGRVQRSLSKGRPITDGYREVYLAELKPRELPAPVVRFIRLLKWGVQERLKQGKQLLQSILETDEYIDWMLDRRLGCRQLGMNLPPRITLRRFSETYPGPNGERREQYLRSIYSERDYIPGIASDKIPAWKYTQGDYAVRLARLLGKAAASNIIVGRTYDEGDTVIFDDGDEVVVEDDLGRPHDLIVGDHSGAFGEYKKPLENLARGHARPVNNRATLVPHPREFAEVYLEQFRSRFAQVQGDYRKRRRAFDTLFKYSKYDPNGSFAFRWECVLRRLDATDPDALTEAIRRAITVLPS